jgi:outer membrane receptor protein involved in Fe transport
MELDDAVTNVTNELSQELILRRRENVGTSRSRGVEIEAEGPVGELAGGPVEVGVGDLGTDAEVTEDDRAGLTGLSIAQVPRHQGSLRLGWTAPDPRGLRIDLRVRYLGDAFDDDLNLLPLGDATVVDLRLARPIGPIERGAEVFVAAENLLDESYAAGRTPVTTLGPPRLVRLGITWRP